MSAGETLNSAIPNHTEDVGELREQFSRTPRPYLVSHDATDERKEDDDADIQPEALTAGSESGTEADDERPSTLIKALPPSTIRPRKGLKTGESNEDALLTPSQLDEKERRVQGYFLRQAVDNERKKQEEREREDVLRRRFAEFVRRSSEVALMGVILLVVLCGQGVVSTAWEWKRELLVHVGLIVMLVAAYPIKLSIVDGHATHAKVWQRFRVPASFDPATVLYPPLLPVLVALSVAPGYPAVVLPNIILGLSSLPQRLFPRSSRLSRINTVHWLVAVLPLFVSENTAWPSKTRPPIPYLLKTPQGLSPETLVALYPLHHALMVPLHYLTTTSLLMSELHLLSAVLINLLLLADSPQTAILKACLWIGGVSLFVACGQILHWNVTLARVPRWKLRRSGHTAEERKSLVDAVSEIINMQRTTGAFAALSGKTDSDADDDEPTKSIKTKSGRTKSNNMVRANTIDPGPLSPEPTVCEPGPTAQTRPRRNTVPERMPPADVPVRQSSSKKSEKLSSLLWYLQLTHKQAQQRKWLYAGATYLSIITIVLLPIRIYVASKALDNQEPIGWAVSYLFGQIPLVRYITTSLGLTFWIPLPQPSSDWNRLILTFLPNIDLVRDELGQANVRLLLIAYWVLVLAIGLLAVFSLTTFVEVDTRRKVFHGVMVAMFLPTLFIDPCYCSLALALVLVLFLLLEVIRAGQVPPLGNAIGRFVAPYVDGRDLRGPVVVSHIFLLIGCAVPLSFSLASLTRSGDPPWQGWEVQGNRREVAMVSGVVCVGMGDAAASLIGRRIGRHKWIWVGGKSLEGSAAFAVVVTVGLVAAKAWEHFGGWGHVEGGVMGWMGVLVKAAFCACGASFMEAVLTGANDNVIVPVALWLLVKGVRL